MEGEVAWWLWAVALVLVSAGVAGLVLPFLPGVPLLFLGLLVAAWAEGFTHVGAGTLAVLAFLALLAWATDIAAGALGARRFGASPRAVAAAGVGALVGIFFGLPGIVLGPFAGAMLAELWQRRSLVEAGRSGVGTLAGLVLAVAVKLTLAFAMIGLWAVARFM